MKVVLLNGSPAVKSHTKAALEYLSSTFSKHNIDSEVIDLKDANLPINDPVYHADASQSPSNEVRSFAKKIKDASIVVLGTPLYHGSYSGLLKLALDNIDGDAFAGKKVLLVSNASGARGSMTAAQNLVIVARTMSGDVHTRMIGTCKADYTENDDRYELTEESIINRCNTIVGELI